MSGYKYILMTVAVVGIICLSPGMAQAPPTIEAALKKYGVMPTPSALRNALNDQRPEVRGLAAGELAELKDTESVPFIVQAFQREHAPVVKLNMALSLFSLGSPVGRNGLLDICNDATLGDDRRLTAASALVDKDDYGCLLSVENVLAATHDSSARVAALLILRRVKVVPSDLASTTHVLLVRSLLDPTPSVRQYAAECIASLGDKTAIPSLQAAVNKESDAVAREHMEAALSTVRSKP